MKTTLTIEQSATLISKGISAERASAFDDIRTVIDGVPTFCPGTKLLFTLPDLLSLLPKKLYGEETDYCDCELHIHANKLGWSASYMEIRGSEVAVMKLTSYGVELIETLFSLLCKLLDNHVKLD